MYEFYHKANTGYLFSESNSLLPCLNSTQISNFGGHKSAREGLDDAPSRQYKPEANLDPHVRSDHTIRSQSLKVNDQSSKASLRVSH